MKRNLLKVLGLVMILALTVTPVMAEPDVDPNPGSGNTDVVIMNMGSAATTATAMYYSASGQNMYQVPTNLAVKGSHRFAASAASPLGDNWKGSMVVQSAGEVAAIAEILWTNGNSLDGTTADAYTGFTTGATTMYVPYALYARDAQFTLFSVQNTESTTANIRLTFVNRDGAQDYQFTDTIPALGSKSYDMRAITQLQSTSFWTSTCATGACSLDWRRQDRVHQWQDDRHGCHQSLDAIRVGLQRYRLWHNQELCLLGRTTLRGLHFQPGRWTDR
jgi:hypothetical protein